MSEYNTRAARVSRQCFNKLQDDIAAVSQDIEAVADLDERVLGMVSGSCGRRKKNEMQKLYRAAEWLNMQLGEISYQMRRLDRATDPNSSEYW